MDVKRIKNEVQAGNLHKVKQNEFLNLHRQPSLPTRKPLCSSALRKVEGETRFSLTSEAYTPTISKDLIRDV